MAQLKYRTKHFGALEKCACGAYRYLAMRERKRLYEILLIHQLGRVRKYRKVASVMKSELDFHRTGNNALRGGDSLLLASLELRSQLLGFITKLQKGDKINAEEARKQAASSPQKQLADS